ncbi:cytochrome b/b6 domain-containing protein [Pararhizobium mangrovi]|uniref:Cytochrome b/b6 domain-containing protein n=1 Tax=Pararhizobium mangrovi TaxID=2590452 RepID=A0A506TYT3_9HYPH|nr:cytochrome b/b6 domain-containing protein [Pararhizobium mangrovi]TPW26368.1 cytochrome b/b6 domain-containing protein [Pararhizobium mangrovi]
MASRTTAIERGEETGPTSRRSGRLVYRQSIWTRLTHWVWAVCIFFMVTSGLMIFNARPDLYVGQQSGFGFDNTVLSIGAERTGDGGVRGVTRVFGHPFDTTGFLGVSGSADNPTIRAIPAWATIPSYYDLGTGRVVHFFFAWILVATMLVWWISALVNRHLWRDIVPGGKDLKRLPSDIGDHARLRFHHTRSYNVLQKLSYAGILVVVIPLLILTGLTMSPGVVPSWSWLLDLFGGRQTARTIHFVCMLLVVLFFIVHVLMVVAAGPINELRSIITGWYRVDDEESEEEGAR